MASIRSQLTLNDGMSGALLKINRALTTVLSGFEQMQVASGKSLNLANIEQARADLVSANHAVESMAGNIDEAANQQENFNRSVSTGNGLTNRLASTVRSLVGAYMGIQGLKKITELSDNMASSKARLELIVDDKNSVESLQRKIYQSAQSSRASYTDTMATVAKLGQVAGKSFTGNDELIKFQELVNKNFVVGGASAQEQSSAMYQLTQALGSGRLQGDEYRSIIENAPLLAKSIEDYMRNVKNAQGSMKDWAAEGLLTADVIKAAVFRSGDEVEKRFEKMPKTWAQIWTSMKNRAVVALNPVLTKINALANNQKTQDFLNKIFSGFTALATKGLELFEIITKIANFFHEHWGTMGPVIYGIVAALTLFKIASAVLAVFSFAKGVAAAKSALLTGATIAETVATHGLNAALLASPITWVIAGIIALIVLFFMFTKQIVGAIWWVGALFKNVGLWLANLGIAIWQVIKNIGLWFANLGLGIWNVIKACASNISAAFNNAWVFVQQGFWGMVNAIMQGLKKIADLANKTLGWMGVNIDTSGFDFAAKKIDELNAKKESFTDISDAWNTNDVDWGRVGEGFNRFDTFQEGWSSQAYNAGAEKGVALKEWMSDKIPLGGIMKGFGMGGEGVDDYGMGLDLSNIAGNTDDIADSTAATAGALSGSSEDLKYLRDLAEKEAINRFTTAEVKVDFTGMTNKISSDMDLDGVISKLTEGFAESLELAAEGVHF